MKSQIQYSLEAGQQVIPSNGEIAVDTDTLEVYISQNVLGFGFLQAEWMEAGMLTGNYEDHILAIKTTSGEIEPWGADGTTVSAVGYKVSNLQTGDQISLTISNELKERLAMETTNIVITIQ